MTDNTQPEALRLALSIDLMDTFTNYQQEELNKAAAELRRQHARIAELEAQLESAGFTAADMATASAQGFRDGAASVAASAPAPSAHIKEPYTLAEIKAKIASNDYGAELLLQHAMLLLDSASLAASAGSEPVAEIGSAAGDDAEFGQRAIYPLMDIDHFEYGAKLYTHPSPPEGRVGGWVALPGALPEPGVPVLLDIGKKYPIRALWAAKHTVEAADDDTDWGEYDEATETYYCPEGWYEWNEHEEIHWAVRTTPCAWAPLPPTTPAGSGKGGVMADRVRNLQPGQRFRLKRTGDLYEFLGHKRDTPGGTQYVVRRSGFAKPSTLHHSCHVVLIQDNPS